MSHHVSLAHFITQFTDITNPSIETIHLRGLTSRQLQQLFRTVIFVLDDLRVENEELDAEWRNLRNRDPSDDDKIRWDARNAPWEVKWAADKAKQWLFADLLPGSGEMADEISNLKPQYSRFVRHNEEWLRNIKATRQSGAGPSGTG